MINSLKMGLDFQSLHLLILLQIYMMNLQVMIYFVIVRSQQQKMVGSTHNSMRQQRMLAGLAMHIGMKMLILPVTHFR